MGPDEGWLGHAYGTTHGIVKSYINWKLNNRLDTFMSGLNLYLHSAMDTFDVKEFITGIMKFGVKMEQSSGIVIKARVG